MIGYILKRLLSISVTFVIVSILIFLMMHAIPGGPFDAGDMPVPEAASVGMVWVKPLERSPPMSTVVQHPSTHNDPHWDLRVDLAAAFRWSVRERWHEAVLAARRLRKSSNATQRAGQRRRRRCRGRVVRVGLRGYRPGRRERALPAHVVDRARRPASWGSR